MKMSRAERDGQALGQAINETIEIMYQRKHQANFRRGLLAELKRKR